MIAGPPGLQLIGNTNGLDSADTMVDLRKLAERYGPMFKLYIGRADRIFLTTQELLNEACNKPIYQKMVLGALKEIRNGVEDELFSAYPGEHNWGVAHKGWSRAMRATETFSIMTILYGSNAGKCEAPAQSLARAAPSHGFQATAALIDPAVD
ncbi:hypothetical protein BJ878DRAFT_415039 [Calycina marina]|uniref:Flavodoxin-like domain-containing protein n=1 Tax=Calycina marina TaxID=1763456 RepID=A0A9P7Z898_9HELO|nr:hypothetical protein BJ878DRAFT_415039 [Calycina marina]